MNNNLNGTKFTKFFKNKNVVIAISSILIVIVLVIGYNIRINNEVKPIYVPVANTTIQPRTKITENMIKLIEVPQAALAAGNFYTRKVDIVNKYTDVNALIPEGSMFYQSVLVTEENCHDGFLKDIGDDEKLYYLTVNMLTSYTNSILPGNYIDIYLSTKNDNSAYVGKLIKDVKVLAVKTSDGKNVFENSDESRVPAVMLFALPEKQHLLLRAVDAINNYAIAHGDNGYSRIQIIPVPSKTTSSGSDKKIEPTVTSQEMENYILEMATIVYDDDDNVPDVTPDVKEEK